MSKSNDKALILPGESGWEIWTQQEGNAYQLAEETGHKHPGDLDNLPNGHLTLLFAAKSVTAVPIRVASDDESLFPDLVALHAERLGLKSDPLAGQLSDVFVIDRAEESAELLAVYLRTPREGDLPPKGPQAFDLAARAFPVDGNALAIWRELGRWTFAIHHGGKLIYCQATANDAPFPDTALVQELKIALMQLSMQKFQVEPSRIIVWNAETSCDVSVLRDAFEAPVEVAPKPAPVVPDPLSKLLPEDVRAARREAAKRRSVITAAAALILIYLGIIGWFGYGLWAKSSETKDLVRQANEALPEREAYAAHMNKWHELEEAVDLNYSPLDIMHRIHQCIPGNRRLRLTRVVITGSSVELRGEGQDIQTVGLFEKQLKKSNGLSRFTWDTPDPNPGARGFEFRYEARIPEEAAP